MADRIVSAQADADPSAPWHTLDIETVQQELKSRSTGLEEFEAGQRLRRYGPNSLAPSKRRGAMRRLLLQFHNILLYVMMGAALITAYLGHWVDTGVLLVAVAINAIIGFIQEGKAESALNAIRAMLSPRATVIRDGFRREIDAADLVPGDWVVLASGDRVPADLRLVAVKELRIDEAALTGESLPVEKSGEPVATDAPLGDRYGMAYAGTLVVYGQASGIVVTTGAATELGKIDQLLSGIRNLTTPLLRQVDRFGRVLALAILGVSAATFVLGTLWRGHAPAEMFMMVVALAASAIPEGLPAIMTVTLALGVQRMARRHAIIRRLPAVEALGSVTVICSDKTGTLTRNEMTVQRVVCAGHVFDVGGVGYAPVGDCSIDGRIINTEHFPALAMAVRAGVLCNDARLCEEEGLWRIEGDPTEGALLVLGAKLGFSQHQGDEAWPRLDNIPFESQHRFMATYHRDGDDAPWIFVKGAPERILDMCSRQFNHDGEHPLDVDFWRRMATDTAAQGLRLLAMACKRSAPGGEHLKFADVEAGFTLLALVGIIDPPREEAMRAVGECYRAGIRVKMITGDHLETARAIGAQLGIGIGKPAVTGAEVALMNDAALRRVAMEVDVFARASPEHKLRLVQALQDDGQVVAMTGDGVNDAPALKAADIGVAMGASGTEVAREAATMVLTDDNFATIVGAVQQGRTIYDNIVKFLRFQLSTNMGALLAVFAAPLAGLPVPFTPMQILWVNIIMDGPPAMALAFDPPRRGLMDEPPRAPDAPILGYRRLLRLAAYGATMAAGTLLLLHWALANGMSETHARTLAFTTFVLFQFFNVFNARVGRRSAISRAAVRNPKLMAALAAVLALQVVAVHWPPAQHIFHTTALTATDWAAAAVVASTVVLLDEARKLLQRLTRRRRLGRR